LEQLHFGAPVDIEDAQAFALQPGIGWGSMVLLEEGKTESCPDVVGLAWSGSGRGDYRESPLELSGVSTDLRYQSHRILDAMPPAASGLPLAAGDGQTLEITLAQPGLQLQLYFRILGDVLLRRAVLSNTGHGTVRLGKIMSMMMDLPGSYEMTTFDGSWIAEMRKHTVPVLDSRVVNESVTGFSSHRHNPGFLLSMPGAGEDHGRVYGFNLIYSGNHYAAAQRSFQGLQT
jgi:alpha-galactosidase